MSDIINLLPDSVANQIAAGEVIQRPASVLKELVENSIDAGATSIQIFIKDGGSTLIQVIDDGKGMSETDARMCFERHATSKIREARDLFHLHSKGFRGEALASIASIAQVELRTKREEDELGTFIEIAGSRVFKQDKVVVATGTNVAVKNLFFNVPARRRFLKSASTEMMHIRNEFYRIALIHSEISFSFYDDANQLYNLPVASQRGRIEALFGNKMEKQLLPVDAKTDFVSIKGYAARPEFAMKGAHNYFFVNNRYMRHPYFHKAIMVAYERLLKPDVYPSYFIRFEIDPELIDVNVHPSKTEIKFENEQVVFSILMAAVKESLGKHQALPALDFDQEGSLEIPVLDDSVPITPPKVGFDPGYNPFTSSSPSKSSKQSYDWEQLYRSFNDSQQTDNTPLDPSVFIEKEGEVLPVDEGEGTIAEPMYRGEGAFQLRLRYLVIPSQNGVVVIDQHRAHFRVLYDRLMLLIQNHRGVSQQLLFPEILELNSLETDIMNRIIDDLRWVGFDVENFGENTFSINGVPSELNPGDVLQLLSELLADVEESGVKIREQIQDRIVMIVAKKSAIKRGQNLTEQEIQQLVDDLFSCANQNYTPDGQVVMHILPFEDIERRFR